MSETQKNIPADWYDDGSGNKRWWDGNRWGAYAPQPPAPVVVAAAPKWSGISITGFVLGIVGMISALTLTLGGLGFMASLLGVIFSVAGMASDNRRGRRGRGLAVAGLILSVPALVLSLVVIFALSS